MDWMKMIAPMLSQMGQKIGSGLHKKSLKSGSKVLFVVENVYYDKENKNQILKFEDLKDLDEKELGKKAIIMPAVKVMSKNADGNYVPEHTFTFTQILEEVNK